MPMQTLFDSDLSVSCARHFSFDDAMMVLRDMRNKLVLLRYPQVSEFEFVGITDKSNVGYVLPSDHPRTQPEFSCQIGIKEMLDNKNRNGMVRDMDLVWAGKHIAHEACHLWQMTELYQSANLSGRDLDMARMDAIASVFHGYGAFMYNYLPSEVDADIAGFEGVVEYFDKHVVEPNGHPVIDVKACLVARVHELPDSWRGDKSQGTYEGIIASLRACKNKYQTMGRPVLFDDEDGKKFSVLGKFDVLEKWKDVWESDAKHGVARDEELFAIMLDVSSAGADFFPCLDQEVRRIREMYPSKLGIFGKAAAKISRFQNMRDVISPFDELSSPERQARSLAAGDKKSMPNRIRGDKKPAPGRIRKEQSSRYDEAMSRFGKAAIDPADRAADGPELGD